MTQQIFTVGNLMNYSYDNIGQLKTAVGLTASGGNAILQEQFGYAYDKAWNLNYRTNNAFVENFSVNDLNELSSGTPSGTLTVAGTTTEPGSDITSVVVNTKAAVVYADGTFATNFTPNYGQRNLYKAVATDKYGRQSGSVATVNVLSSAGYSYDLNGNLTNDGARSFAYDCENELVGVWLTNAWSNSFVYDGLQRRRIEQDFAWNGSGWTETNEIHFVYDGNLVFQERDQNNQTLTTYTRGNDLSGTLQGAGGIGGLLARSDKTQIIPAILSPLNPNPQNVNTAYYHSDGNGNVTALVQASGFPVAMYQYDPFGNMISIGGLLANENKYRFSSKEWDDNAGLFYYGYRFYDPKLQRWINRDPIQETESIDLYQFCYNDSISMNDSLGLDTYICNRQLMIFAPPGGPEPLPRSDPLSHTFVFTSTPDGGNMKTFSWGNTANTHGWNYNQPEDQGAAWNALQLNDAEHLGDSSLDPYVQQAFNNLNQPANEHPNYFLLETVRQRPGIY